MSEFEKELLNKVAPHDRTHYGNELFLGGVLVEHFKDWQPPKELVEVPQCVDVAIRSLSNGIRGAFDVLYLIKCTVEQEKRNTPNWVEVYEWVFEYGNSAIFERAFLEGYTVEKEQLYEVIINGLYLIKVMKYDNSKNHRFIEKDKLYKWEETGYKLTEQQIKKIDPRYMAFAVKVDEVEN